MHSTRNRILLAAGCVASVAAIELGTTRAARAMPAPPPAREVLVVNGPGEAVPVTGQITVDGTSTISGEVAASQSGSWTVGIDPGQNRVSVSTPDPTVLLDTGLLGIGDGAVTTVGPTDLSGVDAVRLFAHGVNGDVLFEVYVGLPMGGSAILVDSFRLGGESLAEYETIFYELPGPSMEFRISESGAGGANARVALYGR